MNAAQHIAQLTAKVDQITKAINALGVYRDQGGKFFNREVRDGVVLEFPVLALTLDVAAIKVRLNLLQFGGDAARSSKLGTLAADLMATRDALNDAYAATYI